MQSNLQDGLHVAIIMDGNGRWAARRGLPRIAGHRAGVRAVRRVIEHAPNLAVSRLTLYAFSSDNWNRPAWEVESLFRLMRAYLRLETERLRERGARLQVIGRRDRLPRALLGEIERAELRTANGRTLLVRVALDYSSRDAIALAAARLIRGDSDNQSPSPGELRTLLTGELAQDAGEVDLVIRAGGEKRLSDFLLWESAYAELFFTDRMWPDFDAADLEEALAEFRRRERRFGGLSPTAVSTREPYSRTMDRG